LLLELIFKILLSFAISDYNIQNNMLTSV